MKHTVFNNIALIFREQYLFKWELFLLTLPVELFLDFGFVWLVPILKTIAFVDSEFVFD